MRVRVVCPACGPMELPGCVFRCDIEDPGNRGLCEMRCPVCSTAVFVPVPRSVVIQLWKDGAGHLNGSAPFELLESHDGPPLSWDDVLDFKLALERSSSKSK